MGYLLGLRGDRRRDAQLQSSTSVATNRSRRKSDTRSFPHRNHRRIFYGGILIIVLIAVQLAYYRGSSKILRLRFFDDVSSVYREKFAIFNRLNESTKPVFRASNKINSIPNATSQFTNNNHTLITSAPTSQKSSSVRNATTTTKKTIFKTSSVNHSTVLNNTAIANQKQMHSPNSSRLQTSPPETPSKETPSSSLTKTQNGSGKSSTKAASITTATVPNDPETVSLLLPYLKPSRPNLTPKIGLLNFERSELSAWRAALPNYKVLRIRFQPIPSNLTWLDLFPPIPSSTRNCPIPHPSLMVHKLSSYDSVVARIPCDSSNPGWAKDVQRHYLTLLTAASFRKSKSEAVPVLILSECRPAPNIFHCSDLKNYSQSHWLYVVDRNEINQHLSMPVGTCLYGLGYGKEVSLQPRHQKSESKEAYATVIHSDERYVCGALALAQSIRKSGSTRDLVLLLDDHISEKKREVLKAVGWILHDIQRIRSPGAAPKTYNEWNYSKLRLWQLVNYQRVIFIDADMLVFRNVDHLFDMPELSASGNGEKYYFNSGLMVIRPSQCTFEYLMERSKDVVSYNGGDQGFLNEIFTWWHRLPYEVNFLKHVNQDDPNDVRYKAKVFSSEPPIPYAVHYLGLKPWLCYRDFDCNWFLRPRFASDEAHKKWWDVFVTLPEEIQRHSWLHNARKAEIEYERLVSQRRNASDLHWNRTIQDPRYIHCLKLPYCKWDHLIHLYQDKEYRISK